MNKDDLCDAFGQIDDQYIMEADRIRNTNTKTTYYFHQFKFAFIVPITICLFLIIQSMMMQPNLEVLQYSTIQPGGFGIATIYAQDLRELEVDNPWKKGMKLDKLPVYRNDVTYGEHEVTKEKKQQMRKQIAYYQTIFKDMKIFEENDALLIAENEDVQISVDENLTTFLYFNKAIPLPDQYAFYSHASKEDLYEAGQYLVKTYKDIIRMKHPTVVTKEELDVYHQETLELTSYEVFVYEQASSIEEQMVNYGTSRAHFYCDEKHQLSMIRIETIDKDAYVDDYPIMDIEDATNAFLNQHPTIAKKDILKTELQYEKNINQPYVLPYYKFYIDAKDKSMLLTEIPNDIYRMETYRIPAIQQDYIKEIGE